MYSSKVVDLNDINNGESGMKQTPLDYPCIVLEGVEYTWEMEYLKAKQYTEEISLPFYIRYEGKYVRLSRIDFKHTTFVNFAVIGEGTYKVEIHKSENDIVPIDCTDVETLKKFIRLS
ncbi:hypothetical protein UT300012_23170 [Paraclostridium bifermentans]